MIPLDTHSVENLPPLAILKKIQVFGNVLRNLAVSNRILWQICYNLEISSSKSFRFRRTADIINSQTSGKIKRRI